MEVLHVASVVADGEVLVDEGLDAEVKGAEIGDGGGEGEPLAEAGGSVIVQEERSEDELLEDIDEVGGEAGGEVFGNAFESAHGRWTRGWKTGGRALGLGVAFAEGHG